MTKKSPLFRFIVCIMTIGLFSFSNPEKPLIILSVGDSITQGGKKDQKEYTYRLPLQMILHREGIAFQFVGSQQGGLHEEAQWPEVAENVPFQPNHEGYYGKTTRFVVNKVMERYDLYQTPPDVVLVHLGTNDQNGQNFQKNVGDPLRELIEFLRQKNPGVIIFLGHLNFNDSEGAYAIRQVVEELAGKMNTPHSPIITVHHYRGWNEKPDDIYADTFDWAHPNLKGQEKMAMNWWEALLPVLK